MTVLRCTAAAEATGKTACAMDIGARSRIATSAQSRYIAMRDLTAKGRLVSRHQDARAWRLRFAAPKSLAPLIAAKGSIAVDGVSLTVNAVDGTEFEVAIIPTTMQRTVMSNYEVGTRVNLEVDMIARYLARLLKAKGQGA